MLYLFKSTCILLLTVLVLAGCAALPESGAFSDSGQEPAAETPAPAQPPSDDTTSITNPNAPALENPPNPQPANPGAPDEPAAAAGGAPTGGMPEGDAAEAALPAPMEAVDASTWPAYRHETYRFSIAYPSDFTPLELDAAQFGALAPAPVAAIHFRDQSLSAEVAAISPPPLAINVYLNEARLPLETWLPQQGLFRPEAGWTLQAFNGNGFSGVRITSPDFSVPGNWYYVAVDQYVYQIIPIGTQAEKMLESLQFTAP